MNFYDLQREDWDSITELAQYSGRPEITAQIPSQVCPDWSVPLWRES